MTRPLPRRVVVASAVLAALGLLAAAASRLTAFDPAALDLAGTLAPPSIAHPMGQDRLGRDILSRVLHGTRVSLLVGGTTVAVSLLVGGLIGALAGWAGGWIDTWIMRGVDVLLAFPGLLLAIALTGILGPSLRNVVLALCLIGWTGYARLTRGEVRRLRERPFVEASHALGAPAPHILRRHVFPLLATPLLVQGTFGMASAIVAEASLSFLGLGVQPPTASWGSMLNEGRAYVLDTPHLTIFPGLAIMITVLALNVLGDGLRDHLDVRNATEP